MILVCIGCICVIDPSVWGVHAILNSRRSIYDSAVISVLQEYPWSPPQYSWLTQKSNEEWPGMLTGVWLRRQTPVEHMHTRTCTQARAMLSVYTVCNLTGERTDDANAMELAVCKHYLATPFQWNSLFPASCPVVTVTASCLGKNINRSSQEHPPHSSYASTPPTSQFVGTNTCEITDEEMKECCVRKNW